MIESIQKALGKYWGFDGFLPLQKQAMECIGRGTDSIEVKGVGEKKREQYGQTVLAAIKNYCLTNSLEMNVGV